MISKTKPSLHDPWKFLYARWCFNYRNAKLHSHKFVALLSENYQFFRGKMLNILCYYSRASSSEKHRPPALWCIPYTGVQTNAFSGVTKTQSHFDPPLFYKICVTWIICTHLYNMYKCAYNFNLMPRHVELDPLSLCANCGTTSLLHDGL